MEYRHENVATISALRDVLLSNLWNIACPQIFRYYSDFQILFECLFVNQLKIHNEIINTYGEKMSDLQVNTCLVWTIAFSSACFNHFIRFFRDLV